MTSSSDSRSARLDPVVERYKRDVDITLIRENLKLTPEERIQKLIELSRLAEELRRAGENARSRSSAPGQRRSR